MRQHEEEALHADAYIDGLLSRNLGPRAVQPSTDLPLESRLRRTMETLAGLPRFHPSFAFEEALAARLRDAAAGPIGGLAEVIRLPGPAVAATAGAAQATFAGIDRRLIVGGAIASGVSLAGLAGAIAWRQRAR